MTKLIAMACALSTVRDGWKGDWWLVPGGWCLVLGGWCEGREAGQGAAGGEEGEVTSYTCGAISALCLIWSLFVF